MKFTQKFIGLAVALAVAGLAMTTGTIAQPNAPAAAATPALVDQKLLLVGRLLDDSPAALRISASNNREAKAAFAQAREKYATALSLVTSGDLVKANVELNDAMWMIGKARQMVPDSMARAVELRTQAATFRQAVGSLIPSYEAHLARTSGAAKGAPVSDATLDRVRKMLDEARAFEEAERIADATRILHDAERTLMAGLAKLLKTATIAYGLQFETQAAEYAYELERNTSYVELMPLAIAELKPAPEAMVQINQYTAQNRIAIQKAQKLAEQRKFRDAINALKGGTAYLQGALAVTGLVLPSDSVAQ